MTSNVNLNQYPYYDDYLDTKGFHKILFKPGYAVQARELTQLQTQLQEQIKRFGDNTFKDGTVIAGMDINLNLKQAYIKVLDQDSNSSTIDNATLGAFVGRYIIGQSTGTRALVKYVSPGLVASNPNLKTLYIDYVSSGTSGTDKTFIAGEILHMEDDSSKTFVIPATTTPNYYAIGLGSFVTVTDGIVYANGNFVLHASQTLPLEKYATRPSFKVGFRLSEEIVNVDTDLSLLDPARGSFNYAAPGADRLKITTVLSRIALTDSPDNKFYLLYEIEDGQTRRKYNKTQYGELRKELARRTYDEAGNYTVRPFPVLVREHLHISNPDNGGLLDPVAAPYQDRGGNANMLAIGLEAGKAYISGFEYETFKTEYVYVNKGISTRTLSNQLISTEYGNYLTCTEVCGNWDLEQGTTVKLLDVAPSAITGGNYGDTADPSSGHTLGTARVHAVRYVSGTPGTAGGTYYVYLYDIVLTSGTMTSVLGLYSAAGLAFANVTSGLIETKSRDLLFLAPASSIKTFSVTSTPSNSYTYRKKISGTVANGASTCTLNLPTDETWAFGNALSPSKYLINFYVVINSTNAGSVAGAYKRGRVLTLNGTTPTRTVTWNTAQQVTLNLGETFASGTTVSAWVDVVKSSVQPIKKSLKKSRYVEIDTRTHPLTNAGPWDLGFADVYQIEGVWAGTYSGATPGTFSEGNTNVTNQFVLDTGQRDNEYAGAYLVKSNTASMSFTDLTLLVRLSYFSHDYSTGRDRRVITIDSYPVDDTGANPNTTLATWQIPTFTSPSTGIVYELRNTVDFRPRVTDTSADATAIGSATLNPVNSTAFITVANGYMVPLPDTNFSTELTFYVGRKDRVAMDDEGNFITIPGIPSLDPVEPVAQDHTMSLAIITIPPYPSLSPVAARIYNRPTDAVSIRTFDNRRYTMRDIGKIEQRINRIEYYTALSLLEKTASDQSIPNNSGVDRFKNGILVDAFTGHNVGNVFDPDYHCAIDPRTQELRPFFLLENSDLMYSDYSVNVYRKPADATIFVTASNDYSEGETITIIGASGTVRHQIRIDSTHVKLYVENVTGTFTTGTLTGALSATVGTITSIVLPQNGHLVTLPYQHIVLAQNKFASKIRNAVSQLLFTYNGEITLDPPQDTWTDTTVRPDVQINFDGNADAWATLADSWGTQWGNWQTNWTGTSDVVKEVGGNVSIQGDTLYQNVDQVKTTTTTQRQTRQGISLSVTPETQTQNIGNRVTDTSVVPYMRSIIVTFVGDRLKPNTRVYPFFDGTDVSLNCRPIDISAVYTPSTHPLSLSHSSLSSLFVNGGYGATLKTDSNGRVAGQFIIPANKFRTGVKPFRLCDDPTNRSSFTTTAASENFYANGLSQTVQGTVVSTRVPRVVATTISDSRQVQDSTSTTSVVGQRQVGVIQNTTINNTYVTVNNTDPVGGTGKKTPFDPFWPPVCSDCTFGWGIGSDPLPPWNVIIPPISTTAPVTPVPQQLGPAPIPTSNETIKNGTVGGSGGGWTNTTFASTNKTSVTDQWQWVASDPIAETFLVEGMPFGAFITKIDLYFQSKSSTLPITVQIREVVNGYPGNTIVPFGTATLYPADINVSQDASQATPFIFQSPVFLQNNVEYCFVVLPAGNNPDYNLWVSELGENSVGTVPVQRISQQPFSGVLFVSANNSTWTAIQAEDIKFTLYRADFSVNTTGSLYLKNAPIDYLNITTAATPTPGDLVISNPAGAAGYIVTYDAVHGVAKVYVTTGTFTGVAAVKIGVSQTAGTVNALEKKLFNSFSPNIGYVGFTPTQTLWGFRSTSVSGIGITAPNFIPTSTEHTTDCSVENAVYSYSYEKDTLALNAMAGSFMMRSDFFTQTSTVSPVIDLRKSSTVFVSNVVNSDVTGETANGGKALSKYITRQVVLDDTQDAEDLRVYLTQNSPINSSIQVYARLLSSSDSTPFSQRPWILLNVISAPTGTQAANTYGEYQYGLPPAVLSGGIYQYTVGSSTYSMFKTFAIKIVMSSTSTAIIPKVKDLRVIALQV